MSAPTTPGPPSQGPPLPTAPTLDGLTRRHPWTGGKPLVDFLDMMRSVPRSSYCYQLQDPMEVHKALKAKMTIHQNEMDVKKFTQDKKELTLEQLADMVADHVEFHGMDSKFYLPDPQDPMHLCYIFQEDSKFCQHG